MAAMVWEDPPCALLLKGHDRTGTHRAAPGTIRGDFSIGISKNIISTNDSVAGPRGRSSSGSGAVSRCTGRTKATRQHPPSLSVSAALSHPSSHLASTTSVDKNLNPHPGSAPLSQTTSLSTFCPTPAQRG